MRNTLHLTFAQLNPIVGDLKGNAGKIIEFWKENQKSDGLIFFPELFLCGYPPEDLALNTSFLEETGKYVEQILKVSKTLKGAAFIPTIQILDNGTYNVLHLVKSGEIITTIQKHTLPNYKVFDEKRIFKAGPKPQPIEYAGYKLGILICEDIWNAEIPAHIQKSGAEILISVNASPYYDGKDTIRKSTFLQNIGSTNLKLAYLNMVGAQDEIVFDGHSFIMDHKGDTLYQAPAFKEHRFSVTLNHDLQLECPKEKNVYDRLDLLYEALKVGVKDYVHKNGFTKALLGLSGGIDSALTAAIAVDALGSENVDCYMLPSEFTSKESLEDANQCAQFLGVSYKTLPISSTIQVFENTIPELSGLAHENTQSRIRGTILMALSNKTGALLLTTGNKSEIAVGYCTLYGDMNGAFNVLKDVYKTEVYKLAEWRNRQATVIPERIISKAPSAELRKNQTDQDSLPPYELLDTILKALVEYDEVDWNNASDEARNLKERCQEHPEQVEKISKLLKNSEFKRYQSAPGTKVTPKAFGRDRRYPLTNHFVNMIEK